MEILIDGPDQIIYQWDTGQRLRLHGYEPGTRVDFARCDQNKAVSQYAYSEAGAVFCDIPDALLMDPNHLHGYVYEIDGDRGETVREFMLPVIRRPMPEDYVAPDEVLTWHELEQRIKKIEDEGVPDEKIAQAVEDYLEENPVQPGGSAGTVEIVDVVDRPPGSPPTVTETEDSTPAARKYILGIPRGSKGVGIQNTVVLDSPDGYTSVTISYTDGEEYTLTIHHGKDYILTPADKAEIAEMAAELVEVPEQDSSQNGDGLTGEEKSLILSLFKATAYTADMSATIAKLESLWGGTGGEEPDIPDEPDEPDVPTYKVTNNLTGVTTDNTAESVEGGKMYTANLTAEAGYTIDSVVVTMGGNVISAYGDGVVYIDSVDGDVVITATAVQTNTGAAVYELTEATTFDGTSVIDTGYTLNLTNDAWTICVDFTGSAGQAFGTHGTVDAQEMRVALAGGYYWQASLCGKAVNGYTKNNACKYVITHGKGETQATAYYLKDGAVVSGSGATHWGSANSNPTTLKLGGKRDGTADFVGTINRFAIYERALTAEEISEFMGVA